MLYMKRKFRFIIDLSQYKYIEKGSKEKLVSVKKSAEQFLIKLGNGEKV